jgi:hypothetical protein
VSEFVGNSNIIGRPPILDHFLNWTFDVESIPLYSAEIKWVILEILTRHIVGQELRG